MSCYIVMRFAQEIDRLTSRFNPNNPASNDHKFIIFHLGPLYVNNLHPALERIKSKADEGCGWEYCTEITWIARYFHLQADKFSANTALVRSVYKQILDGEILFLDHIKDHPVDYAVMRSSEYCERLLQLDEAHKFEFIHPEEIPEFYEKETTANENYQEKSRQGWRWNKY